MLVLTGLPPSIIAVIDILRNHPPVTFTKETVATVCNSLISEIDAVASSVCKQVFGNILLGGDEGIHTERNQRLLMILAHLWEAKSEIACQLDYATSDKYDEMPGRVGRVNDCIRLALPDGLPLMERATVVNGIQSAMHTAHLLSQKPHVWSLLDDVPVVPLVGDLGDLVDAVTEKKP